MRSTNLYRNQLVKTVLEVNFKQVQKQKSRMFWEHEKQTQNKNVNTS